MAAEVKFESFTYRDSREINDDFIVRINQLLALRVPSHRMFDRSSFEELRRQNSIFVVIKADELVVGMAILTVRTTLVGNIMGTIDDLIVDPKVAEMDLSDTFEPGTDNVAHITKTLVVYIVETHARRQKTDYIDVILWNAPHEMVIFLEEMGFTDSDTAPYRLSFRTRNLFAQPLRVPSDDPHGPQVRYGPQGGPHDHPWVRYALGIGAFRSPLE